MFTENPSFNSIYSFALNVVVLFIVLNLTVLTFQLLAVRYCADLCSYFKLLNIKNLNECIIYYCINNIF